MGITAVRELGEALHALVGAFDAPSCDGELAKQYVEAFARLERLAGAGKTLALAQVDRTRAWAHAGSDARSTADWLAGQTGTSLGDAIRETNTARNLHGLEATEEALRAGELSGQQASAITDAAAQAPDAEESLLELSRKGSLEALRKRARQEKAAADDDRRRSQRQHSLRRARRWTDAEGMRCYAISLTPAQAATFEPTWDRFCSRVLDDARKAGLRDSHEAYAADALVRMAEAARVGGGAQAGDGGQGGGAPVGGDGKGGGDAPAGGGPAGGGQGCGEGGGGTPAGWDTSLGDAPAGGNTRSGVTAHALLLIDATAFHRGHTNPGEICELAGVGPIDVASAKRLFGDAIVDIIVTDGVDVRTVAHAGRTANRRQKAALLVNWECEIRGCNVTRNLEIDHIVPYAVSGQSDFEHLGPKCRWHHHLKTHKGWRDGPRDPDGKRTLIPPADNGRADGSGGVEPPPQDAEPAASNSSEPQQFT